MEKNILFVPSFIIKLFLMFPFLLMGACDEKFFEDVDLSTEPADPDTYDLTLWNPVEEGLHSGFGHLDTVYPKMIPPAGKIENFVKLAGWKGERVNCKLVLWSFDTVKQITVRAGDLAGKIYKIDKDCISVSVMRYVLTDQFLNEHSTACGPRDNDKIPKHLSPDMLAHGNRFSNAGCTTRPVWISVNIPPDAEAGIYTGDIIVESSSGEIRHRMTLEVQDRQLPPPFEWNFFLDLWQNPFAVARYHQVDLWSEEHFVLLKPLLKMLADAGQKCITTTIIDLPWGDGKPTYDDFRSMIKWIRKKDGSWNYDFSSFDRYVKLAMECGITRQINCYSMVPINNRFSFYDESASRIDTLNTVPGEKEYENLWKNFLPDFVRHLRNNGWLEKTCVALDERESEEMKHLFRFLREFAPELKISMAGFYFEEINSSIYDFSSNWRHIDKIAGTVLENRKKKGQLTTYYVACGIPQPNNFTFSLPAESCYEGWVAAAYGFDGFLRWAAFSWPENPAVDSRYTKWPAGDTFQIYPDACSSVRFERMRDGIEDYIKIDILRKHLLASPSPAATGNLEKLNAFLNGIQTHTLDTITASEVVAKGERLLYELSGMKL